MESTYIKKNKDMRYKIIYLIVLIIFLIFPSICRADVLMNALKKNSESWKTALIENINQSQNNFENIDNIEMKIEKNIDKTIENLLKKSNGFQNLKRIVQKNFAAYPYYNPQGKRYLKNGFGTFFIINGNAMVFFFSFSHLYGYGGNNTGYTEIRVIWHTPDSNYILLFNPEKSFISSYSGLDIFKKNGQYYFFVWGGPEGSGVFSWFSLWTIKSNKLIKLKEHTIQGYISYNFASKSMTTKQWDYKTWIKQEWIHGEAPVYDIDYLIGPNIKIISKKCLNPWYLVVRDYLNAVRTGDEKKAESFLAKKEILLKTIKFKYANAKIPIENIQDEILPGNDIKIITLYYTDLFSSDHESFYLKQFYGKWKILCIKK